MRSSTRRERRSKVASEVRKRLGLNNPEVATLRHFKSIDEQEKLILIAHTLIKLERERYLKKVGASLDIRLLRNIAVRLGVSTGMDPKYHINELYNRFKSELQKREFETPSEAEKTRRIIEKLERIGVIDELVTKFEKEKKELSGE